MLELRIINNAGHWAPLDAPEASLDLATTFVEKYKWLIIKRNRFDLEYLIKTFYLYAKRFLHLSK